MSSGRDRGLRMLAPPRCAEPDTIRHLGGVARTGGRAPAPRPRSRASRQGGRIVTGGAARDERRGIRVSGTCRIRRGSLVAAGCRDVRWRRTATGMQVHHPPVLGTGREPASFSSRPDPATHGAGRKVPVRPGGTTRNLVSMVGASVCYPQWRQSRTNWFATVAQLVEQRFRKPQVVGSSPTRGSTSRLPVPMIGG